MQEVFNMPGRHQSKEVFERKIIMTFDSTHALSFAMGLFLLAAVVMVGVALVVFRFGKRSLHHPPVSISTRHFLRVISGAIDEVLQLPDEASASRARVAYRNGEFFRFTTLKGRRCVVNFRQVQAVNLTEMPEIYTSSECIDGVQIYLINRDDYFDIHAEAQEIDRFLDDLTGDSLILDLGDWLFDRHEIAFVVTDSAQQTTEPTACEPAAYGIGFPVRS